MTTKWRVYGARIFLASLKKFAGSILLVARAIWLSSVKRTSFSTKPRGGSRGRVQVVRTPPPRDDLRFSNTTGILQKKKYVVYLC